MISKNFLQRMGLGSLITGLSFILIYFSHLPSFWIPFTLLIGLITLLCLKEYIDLLAAIKIAAEGRLLLILSALYLVSLIYLHPSKLLLLLPYLFIFITLVTTFISLILKNKISVTGVGATVLGMVWITIPLTMAYNINYFFAADSIEKGPYWLLFILFVTKMCDTAAYFIGSKLGKHPLAPSISPGKSIEGTIGGLFGALTTSFIFYYFSIVSITLIESLVLGFILAILTTVGDLAESIVKRNAKVKDSNRLPGLGGFFDIMDSLLFTAPFIYFYLIFKYGIG